MWLWGEAEPEPGREVLETEPAGRESGSDP